LLSELFSEKEFKIDDIKAKSFGTLKSF